MAEKSVARLLTVTIKNEVNNSGKIETVTAKLQSCKSDLRMLQHELYTKADAEDIRAQQALDKLESSIVKCDEMCDKMDKDADATDGELAEAEEMIENYELLMLIYAIKPE